MLKPTCICRLESLRQREGQSRIESSFVAIEEFHLLSEKAKISEEFSKRKCSTEIETYPTRIL